jgi:mannose-1-phosphate guanylyltransferase/mannose-1-phosphate guanylyltransferase/mannose-6-phosphate isomerase
MKGLTNYEKENRPWGDFERLTINESTTVKILTLSAGGAISLQTHEHRSEFWRILKGSGVIHIENKDDDAHEGDSFFIPCFAEHRIIAGSDGLSFLEISFGYFDEKDEERLEDKYGRA